MTMNEYRKVYKFDNGYGASVVCNFGSYGAKDGLFVVICGGLILTVLELAKDF